MQMWLWNSGSEAGPVKTEYDPCPEGWRVPTYAELKSLFMNRSAWTTNSIGQTGYWFSGSESYTDQVPQLFFPAANYYVIISRHHPEEHLAIIGIAKRMYFLMIAG